MVSLIKEFVKEKVVLLDRKKLPFPLKGITKLVNKHGATIGVVLDEEVWSELVEYLEFGTPAFWEEIENSRRSGRVPGEEIEKRLGLK